MGSALGHFALWRFINSSSSQLLTAACGCEALVAGESNFLLLFLLQFPNDLPQFSKVDYVGLRRIACGFTRRHCGGREKRNHVEWLWHRMILRRTGSRNG